MKQKYANLSLFDVIKSFFIKKNIDLKKVNIVYVVSDNQYLFNGERWYSPLVDSLRHEFLSLNHSDFIIFRSITNKFNEIKENNKYHLNKFYYILIVFRLIGLINPLFDKISYLYERKMWINIFKKVTPDFIFTTMPNFSLCSAANFSGIKIIDIQHGVINRDHPWYSAARFASKGHENYPSEYWVWDEYTKKELIIVGCKSEKIRVTGILHLKDIYNKKPSAGFDRKNIIITLQYPDDNNMENYKTFEKIISKIISNKKYNWFLRKHPSSDWSKKFLNISNNSKNVDYLLSTYSPLYEILLKCNLHITFNSSAIIEAAKLNIKSMILDEKIGLDGYKNYFLEEIRSGMAFKIPLNKRVILDWIDENI